MQKEELMLQKRLIELSKIAYRRDIVTDNHNATIGKTFYQCESQQYPPLLVANLNDQPTRIVLSFEKYYSTEDFLLLRNEAKKAHFSFSKPTKGAI